MYLKELRESYERHDDSQYGFLNKLNAKNLYDIISTIITTKDIQNGSREDRITLDHVIKFSDTEIITEIDKYFAYVRPMGETEDEQHDDSYLNDESVMVDYTYAITYVQDARLGELRAVNLDSLDRDMLITIYEALSNTEYDNDED